MFFDLTNPVYRGVSLLVVIHSKITINHGQQGKTVEKIKSRQTIIKLKKTIANKQVNTRQRVTTIPALSVFTAFNTGGAKRLQIIYNSSPVFFH